MIATTDRNGASWHEADTFHDLGSSFSTCVGC